jgi:hypothetical protein
MSTELNAAIDAAPTDARVTRSARPWPEWLREPLLHFVVLGAALFAIDHVVASRTADPHVIVVGAEVDREAKELFRSSRGRDPDAKELNALRRTWLDNEILYREGLALQVDRGDPAIRERVIFKALSVVDASVKRPPVDDGVLRQWFDTHRAKYDDPARFDFEEAVLAGPVNEDRIRGFVARLTRGAPGDVEAGLRVFKARPHDNVAGAYGEDFVRALESAPRDQWLPLQGKDGWHAVRLRATSAARPAEFDALRGVVLQDWTDAVMAEQRTAAVRALGEKYRVVHEGDAR